MPISDDFNRAIFGPNWVTDQAAAAGGIGTFGLDGAEAVITNTSPIPVVPSNPRYTGLARWRASTGCRNDAYAQMDIGVRQAFAGGVQYTIFVTSEAIASIPASGILPVIRGARIRALLPRVGDLRTILLLQVVDDTGAPATSQLVRTSATINDLRVERVGGTTYGMIVNGLTYSTAVTGATVTGTYTGFALEAITDGPTHETLYGCAAMPDYYDVTLAGMIGVFAAANGTHTLRRTGSEWQLQFEVGLSFYRVGLEWIPLGAGRWTISVSHSAIANPGKIHTLTPVPARWQGALGGPTCDPTADVFTPVAPNPGTATVAAGAGVPLVFTLEGSVDNFEASQCRLGENPVYLTGTAAGNIAGANYDIEPTVALDVSGVAGLDENADGIIEVTAPRTITDLGDGVCLIT